MVLRNKFFKVKDTIRNNNDPDGNVVLQNVTINPILYEFHPVVNQ